eukprot:sb/3464981/
MTDLNRSWFEITLEEEAEKEELLRQQQGISQPDPKEEEKENDTKSTALSSTGKFQTFLSPLKEAPPSAEKREEKDHHSSGLGSRALLRHRIGKRNDIEEKNPFAASPERPTGLGPRASLRHRVGPRNNSTSPERKGAPSPGRFTSRSRTPRHNKRDPDEVASPMSGKKSNKRFKQGTPDHTPDRKKKLTTPRSDTRLLKNRQPNPDLVGKALFGRERRTSETSVQDKELTEKQKVSREKDIVYGKVTVGYQNYKKIVPKSARRKQDPETPKKNKPYSTRSWFSQIKAWKQSLHQWDTPQVGLAARAKYSSNNTDLKRRGILDSHGLLINFTPATVDDVITQIPDDTDDVTNDDNKVVISRADVPLFTFRDQEEDEEYAMLMTGEDLPDEDDPADETYCLSQDSQIGEEEEDELMMEFEEPMFT